MGAGVSGEDSAMIAAITRIRMLMTTPSPVVDLAKKKAMDADGAALIRIRRHVWLGSPLRDYPELNSNC
jgi:cysteine synthase